MDSSESKIRIEKVSKTPLARDAQFLDGILAGTMQMHVPKMRRDMGRTAVRELLFAAVSEQLRVMHARQTVNILPRFQVRLNANVVSIEFNIEDVWTVQAWLESKKENPLHFKDDSASQPNS